MQCLREFARVCWIPFGPLQSVDIGMLCCACCTCSSRVTAKQLVTIVLAGCQGQCAGAPGRAGAANSARRADSWQQFEAPRQRGAQRAARERRARTHGQLCHYATAFHGWVCPLCPLLGFSAFLMMSMLERLHGVLLSAALTLCSTQTGRATLNGQRWRERGQANHMYT